MATNTPITKRRDREDDELPYARYAFWNPYNVSLFLGGITVGVAIDHPWIAVLTCAAELMWMIFAPDSKLLRALWFDRAFDAVRKAELAERRQERIGLLAANDSARLGCLCGEKQVIERLAKENPSLTVELLTGELAKLKATTRSSMDRRTITTPASSPDTPSARSTSWPGSAGSIARNCRRASGPSPDFRIPSIHRAGRRWAIPPATFRGVA